jgi:hypothetical protein
VVAKVPVGSDSSLRMNPDALKQLEQTESRPKEKRIDEPPKKKLDTSYTVNLSEAGQAKANEPLPPVRSPEEARRQLDLIREASQRSPASLASAHNPSTKSAIDLLT